MRTIIFVLTCLMLAIPCWARVIIVDANGTGDYPTIQAAINDANDDDIIVLQPGTYTGSGNKDIDFTGKEITLKSESGPENCIIDCQNSGRGFYFHSGEDSNSVLDGFTIYRGRPASGGGVYCVNSSPKIINCIIEECRAACDYEPEGPHGAGIYCDNSSPEIVDCIIRENRTEDWGMCIGQGGGMYNTNNSNPTLINCVFHHNTSTRYGGGMYNTDSNPTLIDCIFSDNRASNDNDIGKGGGMFNSYSNPTLLNCIFTSNTACGGSAGVYVGYGGGMYNEFSEPVLTNCAFNNNGLDGCDEGFGGGMYNCDSSTPTLTNCIFWANYDEGGMDESAQIHTTGVGGPIINYSCVQGWTGSFGGTGNIGDDPCFVSGPLGDYYLSQIAAGQASDSPCVDTGSDTAVNLGLNTYYTTRTDEIGDAGIVDMGYHYPLTTCIADIDGDGDVDFVDYAILASQWQQAPGEPSADIAPPPAGDGIVDINDLAVLVEYWLWEQ